MVDRSKDFPYPPRLGGEQQVAPHPGLTATGWPAAAYHHHYQPHSAAAPPPPHHQASGYNFPPYMQHLPFQAAAAAAQRDSAAATSRPPPTSSSTATTTATSGYPADVYGAASQAAAAASGDKSMFGFPPGHPMNLFPPSSSHPSVHPATAQSAAAYHSRPLPAHSPAAAAAAAVAAAAAAASGPLPAHLRSNPYQQAANYHAASAYHSHPHHQPTSHHPTYLPTASAAAAAYGGSQEPKSNSGSGSLANGHLASRNAPSYQQHYGNPKEFTQQPQQQQPPQPPKSSSSSHPLGYGHNNSNSSSGDQQHYQQQQQQSASSATSNYNGQNAAGSGYENMAAQIINSFGGSQLSPNLIHPDLPKSDSQSATSTTSSAPAASSTTTPASTATTTTTTSTSTVSTYTPPTTSVLAAVLQQPPHQPRGPTIDSRTNGDNYRYLHHYQQQQQQQQPPPVDLSQLQPHPAKPSNAAATPEKKSSGKNSATKRKRSQEDKNSAAFSAVISNDAKKFKESDPYSFQDEEPHHPPSIEFGRLGKKTTGSSGSSSPSIGGPVYKFKSALLSRENRTSSTESRASSVASTTGHEKSKGTGGGRMSFDGSSQSFLDVCDFFIDDLRSKTVSVSRRPSLETYRERLIARKERVGNRGRKKKVDIEAAKLAAAEAACDDHSPELDGATPATVPVEGDVGGEKTPTKKSKNKEEKAAKSPKKKSPGRKKKVKDEVEVPCDENNRQSTSGDNNNAVSGGESKPSKKGGLWALPIVPKLPQKSTDKQKKQKNSAPAKAKDSVDLCDVWRQAFGAGKTKKGDAAIKQEEGLIDALPRSKTFLDIPPETRRRPKPNFGGLIHFAPDWQSRVRKHHDKCRVPEGVSVGMKGVNPKILSPSKNDPAPAKEEDLKPEPASSTSLLPAASSSPPKVQRNAVEKIIDRRKARMGSIRSYRKKERKKIITYDILPEESIGLLPTPGLPLLTEDTKDALMGNASFGNFRRQTLLRYLEKMDDSAELKAKILDWKPEVLETKTRRQSNQVKAVTSYKEIFGIDLPRSPGKSSPKKKKKKKNAKAEETADASPAVGAATTATTPVVPVIKSEAGEEEQKVIPTPKPKKSYKKKAKGDASSDATPAKVSKTASTPVKEPEPVAPEPPVEEEEEYIPTEKDEELQTYLQTFALDLLDANLSWSRRAVIQNLVIWEPIDPVPIGAHPHKKYKKYKKVTKFKKRKSGLDFTHSSKKKTNKSRDTSRAGTPEPSTSSGGEVRKIKYSLTDVINEAKNWVTDKASGETIIHRAAKYGYPDVVAYAIEIAKMSPKVKDNAKIPPLHKAAFKGRAEVVDILLRYGVDPNTNVKGTRPLHEALEGGHIQTVYRLLRRGSDPLLYDYSGNMPIDLTENDEKMKRYLSSILADLHGKDGARWNVAHDSEYCLPPIDLDKEDEDDDGIECELEALGFENSTHAQPPYYKFANRKGLFVLATDLKHKIDPKKMEAIEIPAEEFTRTAICTLLGYEKFVPEEDKVRLIAVDAAVKKQFGVEGVSSPTKSSPSKASPNAKGSGNRRKS